MNKHERGEGVRKERRCAQTYEIKSDGELIRFVANDDGEVFPDVSARAPGRGVWVSADKEILAKAVTNNAFAKSLKRKTFPSTDLVLKTEMALSRHCLDLLGFAKRADQLIIGQEKISDHLSNNEIAFLIEASDGSEDGRNKLIAKLGTKAANKLVGCFDVSDLSDALGVANCVHIAMKHGIFAKNWAININRLNGFRPIFDNEWLNNIGISGINKAETALENREN